MYKYKKELLKHKDFIKILVYELDILKELYKNTSCDILLFYPDYDKIYINFNINKIEKDIFSRMALIAFCDELVDKPGTKAEAESNAEDLLDLAFNKLKKNTKEF